MAVIWKDVLYPGTVAVPNGRGGVDRVTFSAADVANAGRVGNVKVAGGWAVPGCWGHQPHVMPVRLSAEQLARDVKSTFGHVVGFRNVGGTLQAGLAVPDPEDVRRLAKVRFVSPRLDYDWVDATGKRWPGWTVTHVAATPRPVQHRQRPFDIQLGHDRAKTVFLSLDAYEVRPVADENDDKGGGSDGAGAAEAGGGVKEILASLRNLGINLPDDSFTDLPTLANALKIAEAVKNGGADEDGDPDDGPGDPPPVEEVPPPVQMGFERVEKADRRQLADRVRNLDKTRRVTPAVRDRLERQVKAVKLGYDDAGNLKPNAVTETIEMFEALPKGAAAITPAGGGAGGKPARATAELSNDRVEEVGPSDLDDAADDADKRLAAWDATLGRGRK